LRARRSDARALRAGARKRLDDAEAAPGGEVDDEPTREGAAAHSGARAPPAPVWADGLLAPGAGELNLQPPPGGLCGPSELRGAPVWDDIQDFSDG
jgi:hypothetical protein